MLRMAKLATWQKSQREVQQRNGIFDRTPLRAPPTMPPPGDKLQASLSASLLKDRDDDSDNKSAATGNDNGSIASDKGSSDSLTTKSSSRMSRTRPSRMRKNAKRKARNERRQEEFLRARFGPQFDETKHLTVKETANQNLKKSFEEAGLLEAKGDAREIQRESLSRVPKATRAQLREFHGGYAERPETHGRFLIWNDNDIFCTICNKKGYGHLQGGEHLKKIEEDALGTLLAGNAKSARRFSMPEGMKRPAHEAGYLHELGKSRREHDRLRQGYY